jgi:hypothetical protein
MDYENLSPAFRAATYGFPPKTKQWFTLWFNDEHIEIFTSAAGRLRRVAELTVQGKEDTIRSHAIFELGIESLHNIAEQLISDQVDV